jgi:1,4-alpha-glucan branching enzyme
MEKGFLSIVLHAHLPYVRHPEHESFFEESWLFEAITECYVPLINVFDQLLADQVKYRLTLSLSPTLISMLADELLKIRYLRHLEKLVKLAEKEIIRTRHQLQVQKLARYYRRFFLHILKTYRDDYQCDLLAAFRKHQLAGNLELITSAATHGFLPLLSGSEIAVRNQIQLGVDLFTSNLGCSPRGFWLPECGYYPGLEDFLEEAGIDYFFVDAHGVTHASQRPNNSVYAPLDCGNGVTAFARDPASSQQVWSSQQGYPGDYDYREHHRDIGFDLELDYIADFILDGEIRINTGIKYHRVTGEGRAKEIYQPRIARTKIALHAYDFVNKRQNQFDQLSEKMDRVPIIVTPFDAELFGHWWFEGPCWLESVLRLCSENSNRVQTISCGDYLAVQTSHQLSVPSASTWGDQGYSSYWVNETNDWIYPLLHKAGNKMQKLAFDFRHITVSSIQQRALNQAARLILLAQASDWPFIIQSGTTVDYAKQRITNYLARFNYLHECIRNNSIDERYLTALELLDDIFPNIDFRIFQVSGKNSETETKCGN